MNNYIIHLAVSYAKNIIVAYGRLANIDVKGKSKTYLDVKLQERLNADIFGNTIYVSDGIIIRTEIQRYQIHCKHFCKYVSVDSLIEIDDKTIIEMLKNPIDIDVYLLEDCEDGTTLTKILEIM